MSILILVHAVASAGSNEDTRIQSFLPVNQHVMFLCLLFKAVDLTNISEQDLNSPAECNCMSAQNPC